MAATLSEMTSHINLEGGVGVAKVDIGWTAPLAPVVVDKSLSSR